MGTMMKILVINTGSSSIKYKLFDMDTRAILASGVVERIGEEGAVADHHLGMREVLAALGDGAVDAVGHRVVHGGESFTEPALIGDEVVAAIRDHAPLAPLHNPPNLVGIQAAREMLPEIPQIAVFDTAFHQTMPPRAFRYAVPDELYQKDRIRRYGFHGSSHCYVARRAAQMLETPAGEVNLITVHLGAGASITAVEAGKCVDTSMGMTPLEGLVMGTRSGDVDPSIVFHLAEVHGMSLSEIKDLLNNQSGLKGLAGDNDMREILARMDGGDEKASLAVDIFTYRIKKYIGAYYAALGRVDAIVFTGGIGENAAEVRLRSCRGLERLGIVMDEARNAAPGVGARTVSAADSEVGVMVIPTDEELEIALRTAEVVGAMNER